MLLVERIAEEPPPPPPPPNADLRCLSPSFMEFFYVTVKDEVSFADFGTRLPQKLKNLSEYMHFLQGDNSNYGHKATKTPAESSDSFLNIKSSSLFRCAPSSFIMTCFAG